MKKLFLTAIALASTLSAASAQDNAIIDRHIAAASKAAKADLLGALGLCKTATHDEAAGFMQNYEKMKAEPPLEPMQVMDDLYFLGNYWTSAWAVKTSKGIVILDALDNADEAQQYIENGLKKLKLDPTDIKYVVVSHAHGDHVGGAKLMQDRFGARLVMGGPDWDMIEKSVNQYPNGKPKRDIVATDGQKITLGDTTVTVILTPGHTPGTLSLIFAVKDNGKPLTVAYSGGTAFNFPNDVPHFDIYIDSQRKMAEAAAAANATVLMSNHSEFDNAVTKIKMIAARKPGEPHPFEIGRDAVARYFKVTDTCAQLARFKLQAPKG